MSDKSIKQKLSTSLDDIALKAQMLVANLKRRGR